VSKRVSLLDSLAPEELRFQNIQHVKEQPKTHSAPFLPTMRFVQTPTGVQDLSVERFEDHHATDAVAQWQAVAVAVAEIGLQSALNNAKHHVMEGEHAAKRDGASSASSSPASRTAQRDVSKSSLWFILDDDEEQDVFHEGRETHSSAHAALHFDDLEEKASTPAFHFATHASPRLSHESRHGESETSSEAEYFAATTHRKIRQASVAPYPAFSAASDSTMPPPKRTERKRKARRRPPSRICKFDGCEQYVVDQGLCVRHGVRHYWLGHL
jgi:hypothetical protein